MYALNWQLHVRADSHACCHRLRIAGKPGRWTAKTTKRRQSKACRDDSHGEYHASREESADLLEAHVQGSTAGKPCHTRGPDDMGSRSRARRTTQVPVLTAHVCQPYLREFERACTSLLVVNRIGRS